MYDIDGKYIQGFFGKHVANGPFIRCKHRWDNEIKMDFQETWRSMGCLHLAEDRNH
jgi:hypothetical protein